MLALELLDSAISICISTELRSCHKVLRYEVNGTRRS